MLLRFNGWLDLNYAHERNVGLISIHISGDQANMLLEQNS